MSSAVVIATDHGKAILLISGGIFREVKDRQYYVGQRLTWDEGKSLRSAHVLRRGLLIAACFVLLLTSSAFAVTKHVPWTVVSVALGETSIQYRLNALNEVLSAEADTEKGQAILETVNTEPYEPLQTAMERTLSAIQEETKADAPVLVEIAPRFGDGKQAEEAVEKAGEKTETQVKVEKAPWHEPGKPKDPPPREQSPANEPEQITQVPAEPAQTGNHSGLDADPTEQNMQILTDREQTGNDPGMNAEPAEKNMQVPIHPELTRNEPDMDARIVSGDPEASKQSPPAPGVEPNQQDMKDEKEQFQPIGTANDLRENQEAPQETAQEMMWEPMSGTNQNLPGSAFQQTGLETPLPLNEAVEREKDNAVPGFQPQEPVKENEQSQQFNAASNDHEASEQQLFMPQNAVQDMNQGFPTSVTDQPGTLSIMEKTDDSASGFHQGEQERRDIPLFNAENIPYEEPVQQSLPPQAPNETMPQQVQDGTRYQSTNPSAISNTPEEIQGGSDLAFLHEFQIPAEKESLYTETSFMEQNPAKADGRNGDEADSQNSSPERPAFQGNNNPFSSQTFSDPSIGENGNVPSGQLILNNSIPENSERTQ